MVESLLRRGFDLQIAPGVICRALVSGSEAVVPAALRVRLLLPVGADQRRGWRALERVIEEVPRSFEVRQLATENLLRVAIDYGDGAEYPESFWRVTICFEGGSVWAMVLEEDTNVLVEGTIALLQRGLWAAKTEGYADVLVRAWESAGVIAGLALLAKGGCDVAAALGATLADM
jgi:hypothetical protein